MRSITIHFNKPRAENDGTDTVILYDCNGNVDKFLSAFRDFLDNGNPRGVLNISHADQEGKETEKITINFENITHFTLREKDKK